MLNHDEHLVLLELASASIRNGLLDGPPLKVDPAEFSPPLQEPRACFVTITIQGALRGCIGHLEATQSVVEDVVENAYSAAFRDPRFPPLTSSELTQLKLHISILSVPEPLAVSSEQDLLEKLQPGTDGIILHDGIHKGTFLPSVWEQLPQPETFIQHLKMKAGLPAEYWSDSIEVLRYHAESIE